MIEYVPNYNSKLPMKYLSPLTIISTKYKGLFTSYVCILFQYKGDKVLRGFTVYCFSIEEIRFREVSLYIVSVSRRLGLERFHCILFQYKGD